MLFVGATLLGGAVHARHSDASAQAPAAQQGDAPGTANTPGTPAPAVQTDPETGERYVEVRPTEPLAQGRWPVEPWLVWTVGALGTLGAAVFLVRRVRRGSRGR